MKATAFPKSIAPVALAFCLISVSGCATRNLWEPAYLVPARPANLRLYESVSPPGVLVEYDERVAGGRSTGRRAYLLNPGGESRALTPPDFIRPVGEATGLRAIPVREPGQADVPRESNAYSAVARSGDYEFVLYRNGTSIGTYTLPFYWKRTQPVGRLLLTPASIAADTAFGVGAWSVIALGSSGMP